MYVYVYICQQALLRWIYCSVLSLICTLCGYTGHITTCYPDQRLWHSHRWPDYLYNRNLTKKDTRAASKAVIFMWNDHCFSVFLSKHLKTWARANCLCKHVQIVRVWCTDERVSLKTKADGLVGRYTTSYLKRRITNLWTQKKYLNCESYKTFMNKKETYQWHITYFIAA